VVGQFSTCEFRRAARAAVRELSFGSRAMNARLDGAVFGCDSIRHARQFVDSLSASSPGPPPPPLRTTHLQSNNQLTALATVGL